jgi:hypothetical protein
MIPTNLSFGPYKTAVVDLMGGLNENESSQELGSGELIECRNYMVAEGSYGGYISTKGYEAFDGVTRPSTVENYVLFFLSSLIGTHTPPEPGDELVAEGETLEVVKVTSLPIEAGFLKGEANFQFVIYTDTEASVEQGVQVTGSISGAIGVSFFIPETEMLEGLEMLENLLLVDLISQVGRGIFLMLSGEFVDGEDLEMEGVPLASISSVYELNTAPTEEEYYRFSLLAGEAYIALAEERGGYLAIEGVSASGAYIEFRPWEAVTRNGIEIGLVHRWRTQEGATYEYFSVLEEAMDDVLEVPGEGPLLGLHIWSGITYAFRKKVSDATIGIYKESSSTGWVEVSQGSTPLAYSGSGHSFVFSDYNFLATSAGKAFYFCDGVNKAREVKASGITIIDNAGMDPDDKPTSILAVNDRLYLAYRGGSLQGSTLGSSTDWTTAPVEFGVGKEIVSLSVGVNSTVLLMLEDGIKILNGTIEDNFELTTYSESVGAIANTTARLFGTTFFVSDRGLTTLEATPDFGDYDANTISKNFKKTLLSNRSSIVGSVINRSLNQYRIFFSSGRGVYVSFEGGELKGATLVDFTIPISVLGSGLDVDGDDYIVFGSEDGYVYRMDSGKSFNGKAIVCFGKTAFYNYGSERNYKLFKKSTFEIFAENGQQFSVKTLFDYQEPEQPRGTRPNSVTISRKTGQSTWGLEKWGVMTWGGTFTVTANAGLFAGGLGVNMSYTFISGDKYRDQHIIQNIITDYILCARRT